MENISVPFFRFDRLLQGAAHAPSRMKSLQSPFFPLPGRCGASVFSFRLSFPFSLFFG